MPPRELRPTAGPMPEKSTIAPSGTAPSNGSTVEPTSFEYLVSMSSSEPSRHRRGAANSANADLSSRRAQGAEALVRQSMIQRAHRSLWSGRRAGSIHRFL